MRNFFRALFRRNTDIVECCSLKDYSPVTQKFFETLEHDFLFLLFDEVLVLKKLRSGYEIVHHQEYGKRHGKKGWKDRLIANLDFFLDRIMKSNALADGEGVFTWNQEGALFDVMIREGNYYIAFNNSTESINSLQQKHPFNEEKLIRFLSVFAKSFNIEHT